MTQITAFAGSLLLPLLLLAQAVPPGVQKMASVEGIAEYRLANGLQVLLFPDPGKQTITVNMTYLVGSRHEGYGETGMAHLLEHMVFRGTPKHPKISEEFRKYGARVNGTTWYDRTNYFETFTATDENLRWALDLEADRMLNSNISKQDLDQEMTVVRNEFERGENNPQRVLNQRVMATAFLWHNYGKATIGARSDLENVPAERLKAFYQKYYQPDNAVLTVAGKIDQPKTLALVVETFGKIPRPQRTLERTYTLDPTQDGERTVTVRRVGDIQGLLGVYKIPDAAHPDTPALNVLSNVLAQAPSGRLYKALVETKKAASVYGYGYNLREPGALLIGADVRKEGNLQDVKETLLRVVHNVGTEPPTTEEVERAKNSELSSLELSLSDSERVGLMLSEPASAGDWRLIFRYRENLKKVTPADVARVARTYLKEDNRTLGFFIPVDKPDRAEIPPVTDVAAAMKDVKLETEVSRGEAFEATPQNIEKRLTRSTLPSGMKLVLLPKETRGDAVQAMVRIRYGTIESTSNRNRAAAMTASMLMRGTKDRTRQQIREELDKLRARVMPAPGLNSVGFRIETRRESLGAVLGLVAEMLRTPSFPAGEYESLKQSMLASVEQRLSEPGALASASAAQHVEPYKPGDPRRDLLPSEEVEAIKATTLDDIRKFHAEFYGASHGELVVVGDHDAKEIAQVAGKLFGDWKTPSPWVRPELVYTKVQSVDKVIATPDKANASFAAGMLLAMNDEHPEYAALMVGTRIFGSGMGSRLLARIRAKEGLSYGVGAGISIRPKDAAGTMMASAIAAPQNIDRVQAVFKEELAKAIAEGFTEAEVAEAKKGLLQSRTMMFSQDSSLVGLLGALTEHGRTMEKSEKLNQQIAAATREQINAAFRKWIDPAQFSYFKAGDFTKTAAATPAASRP